MRSKIPIYSLARQLVRPSWNKYNLFNLSRKQVPSIHNKTMYQQKWNAKKETRAYHGDHLSERQFKTIWKPRLVGVAGESAKDGRSTPLASQTYASLERRLDIAVFRALFASSARQARQMIVHGKVKVNSTQIKHPGYLLKAGDLFEVHPAAVIMNVSPPHMENSSKMSEVETETEEDNTKVDPISDQPEPISGRAKSAAMWEEIGRMRFVPKPFMSAFAFVPSYLEVSYDTCSAIYLRDPVARPGLTEVPSPLPANVHALAANFYQRGR